MTDKDSESGKKRLTVRATPEQLAILKCAFMHSAATPKDVLKRLSDETGLYVCGSFHSAAYMTLYVTL